MWALRQSRHRIVHVRITEGAVSTSPSASSSTLTQMPADVLSSLLLREAWPGSQSLVGVCHGM